MSAPTHAPGTCFKFIVGTAAEAATVIRERLGDHARVLSVRNVPATGIRGLFSSPKLEVIAQIAAPEPVIEAPAPEPTLPVAQASIGDNSGAREAVTAIRHARSNERQTLSGLLRRSGFSETLVGRLEAAPDWRQLSALPIHRGLVEVSRRLRRAAEGRRERAPISRAAFLGTSGVGRTTALAKWLASEVFRRARMGHVVTAEFDRPNVPGPLPVFCEALGVPLAHFPASTEPATDGGFVYFDLPGLSLHDPSANAAIGDFLAREKITERVLVLNAAYDHAVLRAGYAAGRSLGATHVVFTHLDEVTQWGRLWDYIIDGELTPLFLGTGPSLTADMEEDAFSALARRTLPVVTEEEPAAEDEESTATSTNLHVAA